MRQQSITSFFKNDNSNTNYEGKQDDINKTELSNSVKKPHRIMHNSFTRKHPTEETIEMTTNLTYDPSKDGYHALKDATWEAEKNVPFIALCSTLSKIEATSSRIKMISILTNYFHSVLRLTPNDLVPSIYFCLNQIGPLYEGKELGIGETSLIAVIADCTGKKSEEIKKIVGNYTDLGILAETLKTNQNIMFKHTPLTVIGVFDKLKEIGNISGKESFTHKKSKIHGLVAASHGLEIRYLIRFLQKKLRIGLAEQSLLVSISHAIARYFVNINKTPSEQDFTECESIFKTSFCELPNYDILIKTVLEEGLKGLRETCRMKPGIPVKPMLANSSKSVSEVLKNFKNNKISCEYKYDGERAQIHLCDDKKVYIYSRNQENSTVKFPDIVNIIPTISSSTSFIIDSEVVAFDISNGKILPFQQLTTRKRKNVNRHSIEVQVCVFVFDLLYLNGENVVTKTYRERRNILHQNFTEFENKFKFAIYRDAVDIDDIQLTLDEAIAGNCEGLILKSLDVDATYEIAKRSHNWRKLKKDYMDDLGDSFDLVVIGAYMGVGKRSGTYGGYLLACYDPDNEEYQSVCKIGSGFTDEDLKNQYEMFSNLIIDKPSCSYKYPSSLTPYHWFNAKVVWQIRAADITLSLIHLAAFNKIEKDKGISLRFPRFEIFREDKKPEEATDIYQLIDLYQNQFKNEPTNNDSHEIKDPD